jgi:hypothetical protein
MEAVLYFEAWTGLYYITIVTMVIVSSLELLHVLLDSFFCGGETPTPVRAVHPAKILSHILRLNISIILLNTL